MSGFLTPALREFRARVLSTNPQNPAYWLQRMFGGASTATGKRIDGEVAMTYDAYYAACRNIGQDIGTLSFPVYKRTGEDSREIDRDHPAWSLLNVKANPEMGASDFRTAIQGQAVGRGNGYAEIEWDGAMRPLAFWPLRSDRMRLVRNGVDVNMRGAAEGQLIYLYTLPSGQERPFAPANILHIRGFSPNGLVGYSLVELAREAIAIELSAEEYLARFFRNDATPGVVLRVPKETRLTDKGLENLRGSWETSHESLSNAHRMAILEDGIDIATVGMSHDDAEFMATRKFSVAQMSRRTRIPAHMLGDLENAHFNNVEHLDIEYTKYTLRSWTVSWKQELALKNVVREPHFAEMNLDAFVQGDMAARSAFYHSLRQDGAITAVDIRKRENLPTDDLPPGAEELWFPLNMAPASAYDENGMRLTDRINAVGVLVKAGFDPARALEALNLPAIDHSGLVPITVQLDPEQLQTQQGDAT